MKIYAINTSWVLLQDWMYFPKDDAPASVGEGPKIGEVDYIPFCAPVMAYLIDHPDGWILMDTGFSKSFMEEANKTDRTNFSLFTQDMDLDIQLATIGLKPEDIKSIVISHIHPDHVGQLDMFPGSKVYVPGIDMDKPHFPFEADVDLVKVYDTVEIGGGLRSFHCLVILKAIKDSRLLPIMPSISSLVMPLTRNGILMKCVFREPLKTEAPPFRR